MLFSRFCMCETVCKRPQNQKIHVYKYPNTARPIIRMDTHCKIISPSVSFMPFVTVASHAASGLDFSASVISALLATLVLLAAIFVRNVGVVEMECFATSRTTIACSSWSFLVRAVGNDVSAAVP